MKICLSIIALTLAGCTTTTYRDNSGATFSRTSFLTKASVGKVEVHAGDKALTLEGYSNEQTETAAIVANAVAAAVRTAK